jgi:hypothetical protein
VLLGVLRGIFPVMESEREERDGGRVPVRVFRLGTEPHDDLSTTTTVSGRLDMLRELTERAWRLTGRPFPTYARSEIPVRVTRGK